METKKSGLDIGYFIEHIGTLLVITVITGLLLAVVNQFTAPIITEKVVQARFNAMAAIMPTATDFEDVDYQGDAVIEGMVAAYQDGHFLGWCVNVGHNGFDGPVSMIVGIDPNGAVIALEVLAHTETPGLGTKAVENPDWLSQFTGSDLSTKVDAISGATKSSNAVINGVQHALTAVADEIAGGDDNGGV
jgi:Predicted NADH:ubiquinone oxidoreductase, subunit RnfG